MRPRADNPFPIHDEIGFAQSWYPIRIDPLDGLQADVSIREIEFCHRNVSFGGLYWELFS